MGLLSILEIPNCPEVLDIESWEEWERDAKKRFPVRWFVGYTLPRLQQRIHDAWYYLKCRLWRRHNVINIRTLWPTWVEPDDLMLHAAFHCLTYHVEKNGGNRQINATDAELEEWYREFDPKQINDLKELRSLYRWWKQRDHEFADDYEVAQANLCRLAALREYLWT